MARSRKVLVLEDEDVVLQVATRFLSMLNLEALTATNVADAIEIADNHDIGLGFLDYEVEGPQTGDVVAEYLQQRKIPMIIISGGVLGSTPQDVFDKFSPALYLPKPFNFSQFEEVVKRFYD